MHILVVSPHPDDAEYGAGGLLLAAQDASAAGVTIACFPSNSAPEAARAVAEARRREAGCAAELLKASLVWLKHPGDGPGAAAGHGELLRLFRTVRPDLAITVDPNDRHPFHRQVAAWVEDAAFQSANPQVQVECSTAEALPHPPQMAFMEAFSSIDFRPDVYANVTPWFTAARKALLAHATGVRICPGLEYQMRVAHMKHGVSAGVPFAEGFRLAHGHAQDWVEPRLAVWRMLADINAKARHGTDLRCR